MWYETYSGAEQYSRRETFQLLWAALFSITRKNRAPRCPTHDRLPLAGSCRMQCCSLLGAPASCRQSWRWLWAGMWLPRLWQAKLVLTAAIGWCEAFFGFWWFPFALCEYTSACREEACQPSQIEEGDWNALKILENDGIIVKISGMSYSYELRYCIIILCSRES